MTLPAPSQLVDLPAFDRWWPGQDEMFSRVMSWFYGDSRFLCVEAPTGSGKSLISVMAALLSGSRTVILTATKGLQSQLMRDFGTHAIDIRGQSNYPCRLGQDQNLTVDEGVCHSGVSCEFKASGCSFYDKLRDANNDDIVSTNYAFWLAQNEYSDGLGKVGLLVCDEAHMAFASLESHIAVSIHKSEVERMGLPPAPNSWGEWRAWASVSVNIVKAWVEDSKKQVLAMHEEGEKVPRALVSSIRSTASLEAKLNRLSRAREGWAWDKTKAGWSFTPVWPRAYGSALFRDIPKVLLMSAIVTEKTAHSLGVDDATIVSEPSHFPIANTPIVHIKTVRLSHNMTPEDFRMWVSRIDQILDRRLTRKGIIFTVSYRRRSDLISMSRHADRMWTHDTNNVTQVVQRFKDTPEPATLVSPSITSGWDFPGDTCRFIIIGKIPYPDTRPAVIKARQAEDPEWTSYQAMQTLVQEAGRGTRSDRDQCEVFIVDDNWYWFWKRYKKFAPKWFHERVKHSIDVVPSPPW